MAGATIEKEWVTYTDAVGQQFRVKILSRPDGEVLFEMIANYPLFTSSEFVKTQPESTISELEEMVTGFALKAVRKIYPNLVVS